MPKAGHLVVGFIPFEKHNRLKKIIPSYRLDENKHTQEKQTQTHNAASDTCLYHHFKAVVLISTCVLKMCVCVFLFNVNATQKDAGKNCACLDIHAHLHMKHAHLT